MDSKSTIGELPWLGLVIRILMPCVLHGYHIIIEYDGVQAQAKLEGALSMCNDD